MAINVSKVGMNAAVMPAPSFFQSFKKKKEDVSELISKPENGNSVSTENEEQDKNFIKEYPKLSLFALGLLGLVVYSVGRNPRTLAQVINGSSKPITPKYVKANKIVDELMQTVKSGKNPKLTEKYKIVMERLFQKPQYRTPMSHGIDSLEKDILKAKLPADCELSVALEKLKTKLNSYLDDMEKKLLQGKADNSYQDAENFFNANKDLINKVQELADKNKLWAIGFNTSGAHLESYVCPCPAGILPANRMYFHGTTKTNAIYKTGLNPFGTNQEMQRELGAGIYTTPDVRVAGLFSNLHGTILPLKLDSGAKVAFVDPSVHFNVSHGAQSLLFNHLNATPSQFAEIASNAPLQEAMIRRLFVEAGYDAAYMPKAIKSGLFTAFLPDVNKVLGRPQSQLAVFNGEKLEIIDRNVFQRIGDTGCKFATYGNVVKYLVVLSKDVFKFFLRKSPTLTT